MGEIQDRLRLERRLWLAGTASMALIPARFAAVVLTAPPGDALASAPGPSVLTAPLPMIELLGPIDAALKTSGPFLLPALIALFFLLRLWFRYGRRLFKPVPAR